MTEAELKKKVNSLRLTRREKGDLIAFILPVCDKEPIEAFEGPIEEETDELPKGYEIKEIDDVFKIYKNDGTRSIKNCESYEEAFYYIKELEG